VADARVAEVTRLIDGLRRDRRQHPYRGRGEYSERAREVAGAIADMVESGGAADAVPLARRAVERVTAAMLHMDDSSGIIGDDLQASALPVQALALDTLLHTVLDIDLPDEVDMPVAAAVYFSVAEALANVTKHAGARSVKIMLSHAGGMLQAEVADDGAGFRVGADPALGAGLAGVERRLETFDGILAVSKHAAGIFGKLDLAPSDDDNRRVLAVLAYLESS
jgi:signal transduction histidine kinase